MEERRCLERLKPYYYLRVYDEKTGNYVGSVADITIRGMRMLSEYPLSADTSYRLAMRLPPESFFGNTVSITATCRWTKDTDEGNSFEAGFEFTGDIAAGIHTIRTLVQDLQARNRI